MKAFKDNGKFISPQHILDAWSSETSAQFILSEQQRASRRDFLNQSLLAFGSLSIAPVVFANNNSKNLNSKEIRDWSQPWLTISHVQNHLFPRSGKLNTSYFSPGANDFNATGYLITMLSLEDADREEREFIIKGVSWLEGMANNMFAKSFIKLDKDMREKVLQKISKSNSGESWLSTLLNYIFEALLSDPVYGGNIEQVGWKWLQHQAGFPRPLKNKKYWLLRDNTVSAKNNLKGAS